MPRANRLAVAPAGRLLEASKRYAIIYHDSFPSLRWQMAAFHGKPIIRLSIGRTHSYCARVQVTPSVHNTELDDQPTVFHEI